MCPRSSQKAPQSQTSFFASSRWLEDERATQGFKHIVGSDEAGRGPLAGPVVAAAVILPASGLPPEFLAELDDSKKLKESQREKLFPIIHDLALAVGVGIVSAVEIDQINILQASFRAMQQAISRTRKISPIPPDLVLIDGKQKFEYDLPLQAIVGGDHKCRTIASASIVAKVIRDRIMHSYASLYPEYQLEQHKGYPTVQHKKALIEFGPTPIHRYSFKSVLPVNPKK